MDAGIRKRLAVWRWASLVVAAVGVVMCTLTASNDLQSGLEACLLAFSAAWPVSIGCMGLLALGNLTGGRWSIALRPYLKAGTWTLPLAILLFIPIAIFVDEIYPWAQSGAELNEYVAKKLAYLNTEFFLGRSAAYFVSWLLAALAVTWASPYKRQPGETAGMRRVGAACVLILVLTATFGAFDWTMSLEPQWYSSIYGAIVLVGGVLAAHAVCTAAFTLLPPDVVNELLHPSKENEHRRSLTHSPEPEHQAQDIGNREDLQIDLGNLLLAFVMVWAYFSFSQFLIIWSGNLPSEISWYLRRLAGGWEWVALAVVVMHFALPFFALLSRDVKRSPNRLRRIAGLLLTAYLLHLFWVVQPAFAPGKFSLGSAQVAAIGGAAGLWSTCFLWRVGVELTHVQHSVTSRENPHDG